MRKLALLAFAAALLPAPVALAEWKPSKPVEFVVTAGAGGGTDIFARAVQAAVLARLSSDHRAVLKLPAVFF